MNSMSYKGYTAHIEYDERDTVFIGRIIGIRGIISFHGETVADLQAALYQAINDYLSDCAERGIQPEKPASGELLLQVPPDVHNRALIAAKRAGKSMNQWASEVLSHAVHAGE